MSDFVLTMSSHPKWVLVAANIMAIIQLLVGEQVRIGG